MSASVRVAGPDDAEAVADLLIGFRDHFGRTWPSDAAFRAGVRRLMGDPDTDYLLAEEEDDGTPVGVVQLRFRYGLWRDGLDCLVEDVFVLERARGGGVGRALMRAAVDHARSRGARRMELDVNEANPAALALYGSLGFSASAEGSAARDLYMRVHLDPGVDG